MSGPSGNQLVLFSLESCPENKFNCFPQDLTLSVYNLLNIALLFSIIPYLVNNSKSFTNFKILLWF